MSAELNSRRVGGWLAALYLFLQLSVPLYVLGRGELSSRDFSWDMFSYQLSCEQLDIRSRVAGGPWQRVALERDFSGWAQLRRLLSVQRFTEYAHQVCQQSERADAVELRIGSRCSTDRDAAPFEILDSERDFCMTR